MTTSDSSRPELYEGFRENFDALLDEHRGALSDSLNGLSEDEARRSLVPSRTTLLGLVKHATFVEGVYFDEAITGRTRKAIGISSTPDRSFMLTKSDTIESIQAAHARACEASRQAAAQLRLDDVVVGHGEQRVGRIYQIMLRELAQHCGHADILREMILAQRDALRRHERSGQTAGSATPALDRQRERQRPPANRSATFAPTVAHPPDH